MVSEPHVSMENSLTAFSPDLVVICINPFVRLKMLDMSTSNCGVSELAPDTLNLGLVNGVTQSSIALQNL